MKLIKLTLYESMKYSKAIYVNPEHVEFIVENPEGKTDIGLASGGQPWKVTETVAMVIGRLGIED
jgi:uncharacterized protein YlzI (FlbEa/FlbD family)